MKSPKLTLERTWGQLCLQIISPSGLPSYVEFTAYTKAGDRNGGVALKPDELETVAAALMDCARLLLGDKKHRAKESA